jgi:hypothetical protein
MYGLTGIGFGAAADMPGIPAIATTPGPAVPGKKEAGPILPAVIIGIAATGDSGNGSGHLAWSDHRASAQITCLPKGISDNSISLRCCRAKGMPMIVMKSSAANTR